MAINIYREYSTDELILGFPCKVMNVGNLYPIKVKDWLEFLKYGSYLRLSYKHLKLKKKEDLLLFIFQMLIADKCKDCKTQEEQLNKIDECIKEFERMFSLIFRMDMKFIGDDINDIKFQGYSDNGKVVAEVNKKTYEMFRIVVMKLNCMQEELLVEDDIILEHIRMQEASDRKRNNITLGDIILKVSCYMNVSIEAIKEWPIFLLYGYFQEMIHFETCKTLDMYRCAGAKVDNISITDTVIPNLYKRKTLQDYLRDANSII